MSETKVVLVEGHFHLCHASNDSRQEFYTIFGMLGPRLNILQYRESTLKKMKIMVTKIEKLKIRRTKIIIFPKDACVKFLFWAKTLMGIPRSYNLFA